MNCEHHINLNFSHLCLTEGCKQRLICQDCQHNPQHFLIPISDLNKRFTDLSPKWADSRIRPILEFLKQNNQQEINFQDIDVYLNYIFDNFLREITLKLREVQNYLSEQLKLLAENALKNVQYLKQRVDKIYDLEELGFVLQKHIQGTYSKESFEQILKDYSANIQGNTEIENIYNYITNDGVNHNYLDIIQIDLQGFHQFKSRILSHFARVKDFDTYLPRQYSQLPTKTHASFSWNIIKPKQETNNSISKIPKSSSVSIYQFKSKIVCVINHEKIIKYNHNFKYLGVLHKCSEHDFYISTFVDSSLQLIVLWSQPTDIQMYQEFRKVRIIKNAALNPISQILFINKYNLFANGFETCILTLDSNGILKLNPLSNNYLYEFTYGSGIIEAQILPESKHVLKQSMTFDAVFDLVVCSYQKNQVKLAIRSLFSASPLSRIWDDETLESKLGLLEHCQVYFTIVQLSQHEKIYMKKHMDVEGIDYIVVTLLNNIVSFWNWKTGKAFRVIDAVESYGLRDMPAIVNGSLLSLLILIGLDGTVYCVNWMKGTVGTCKLRISNGLQIHAMSQQLSKLGSQQFIVILRHIKQPNMTVTQLMYY